jgi:hypothetical protein
MEQMYVVTATIQYKWESEQYHEVIGVAVSARRC